MAIKVAINGFGRIGRNVFRAMFESGKSDAFDVVAVNDLGDANTNAHLLQYDTAHGRFGFEVEVEGDGFRVGGESVKVLAERDPANLPWQELGVDVVMECTGFFASKEKASAHLQAGAKKGHHFRSRAGRMLTLPSYTGSITIYSRRRTRSSPMRRAPPIVSLPWSRSCMTA